MRELDSHPIDWQARSDSGRLRIAIQKSGRLTQSSADLLDKAGLDLDQNGHALLVSCRSLPVEGLRVRDDDIPAYVANGIAHMGLIGGNVLAEYEAGLEDKSGPKSGGIVTSIPLGFGKCRFSVCVPEDRDVVELSDLAGSTIATSYPNLVARYFSEREIPVSIVKLSGAVEISTHLGLADAICDLVSTGATLRANNLKEFRVILHSECQLVLSGVPLPPAIAGLRDRLVRRITGVLEAQQSKYILLNAPESQADAIVRLIPGLERPTIMPLDGGGDKVAIHAVAKEEVFWQTMDKLKAHGASSILVMPIEKLVD